MLIRGRGLIPVTLAALALGAATAVPVATADASTAGYTQACSAANLQIRLGLADGAAGTVYQQVHFRNTGSSPCTIDGYPRFVYLNHAGDRIGFPAAPTGAHHAVTLRSGGAGVAALGIPDWQNFPAGRCHARHATQLVVRAPGTSHSRVLDLSVKVCTTKFGRSTSLAVRHHF
jgi:Protein of unknown function (DUF4232)